MAAATTYAATNYYVENQAKYWDTPPTQSDVGDALFTEYFAHVNPKGGYIFHYISNVNGDTDPTNDSATQFVYLAFPCYRKNGIKAFYGNEKHELFETTIPMTKTIIEELKSIDQPEDVNFSVSEDIRHRFTTNSLKADHWVQR